MKTDAEKKLKPKRPRKVIKKSHMEDSYPTYLQVCLCAFSVRILCRYQQVETYGSFTVLLDIFIYCVIA